MHSPWGRDQLPEDFLLSASSSDIHDAVQISNRWLLQGLKDYLFAWAWAHSGGSILAESDMLGHADTNDGGRSNHLGLIKEILTFDPRAWTGSSH